MRFSMIQTSTRPHPFFSLRFLLFAACLLFSAVYASHAQESNSEVHIPNPGLRSRISQALFGPPYNPSLPITQEDMQALTRLYAYTGNISDLTGLEHATNLEYLSLYHNNISDISPLRNLTNLTSLSVGNNNISDISPLSGLTKLKNLGLANNPISDFSPIAALIPKLTWYESSPSASLPVEIPDGPLRNAIRWKLGLANDHTITAGEMCKLRRLETTNVSSLKGLEYATQLTTLRITNSRQLSDISALSKLGYLRTLDLSYNNISNLSPLRKLRNLRTLDLSNNHISNLSPLRGLRNHLHHFSARGNPLGDSGNSDGRSKRSTETDDLPAPGSTDVPASDTSNGPSDDLPTPGSTDGSTPDTPNTPSDDLSDPEPTDGSASDPPNNLLGDLPAPGSTDVPASDTPNGPTDNLPAPGSDGVPVTEAPNGLTDTQTTTGLQTTEVNLRDVNRDGKVDTDDAEIVFRLMGISQKKLAEVQETDQIYPDVDEDGDVDDEDLKEVGGSVEGSKNPDDSGSQ